MDVVTKFIYGDLNKNIEVQKEKPRYGNNIVITGAGSYYGWATICQLAYKLPGCHIFVISKDFIYENAIAKIYELFGTIIEIVDDYYNIEDPDIFIDLDSSLSTPISRSIIVTNFNSNYTLSKSNYPITLLKTPLILGNWNVITLLDSKLKIRNENFITNIFQNLLYSNVIVEDKRIPIISLEDFTRTIVKLCRKEKPPSFEQFEVFERYITISQLYNYCFNELENYSFPYDFTIEKKIKPKKKKINKRSFIELIDKHRCGIETLIKYSCLEAIMETPLSDYKKFIIQRYPSNIKDYFFEEKQRSKFISKDTKVMSIGSCFAENIAKYLKKQQYNYLVTEENSGSFSANWGIVFNSSSIRQIFEYSFGLFTPIVRWWDRGKNVQDPFRRNVLYNKGNEDIEIQKHIKASRKAIVNADVIIITLGLVEVWRDKRDHATYWRVPPMHLYDKDIHEFYVMTYEDVYNDLMKIKEILDSKNPTCNLIVTVSPVPFQATYREDVDVVTANVYSKAISSLAAIDFCTKNNIIYFPSFEFVRYGFDNPYIDDGRHINKKVINTMMKFFEKLYCKKENK